MATKLEELALELLALPAASRAKLASRLIASLDEREDPDAEALWLAEAQRRLEEIESGKVTTRSADEVFRRAESRLRRIGESHH